MGFVAVGVHIEWMRARNLRPGTIEQRRRTLYRLRRHVDHDLLTVSGAELAEWISRPTTAAEAKAMETTHVRQFYRWAVAEGWIEHDPTVRLARPKLHRRLPRPMPDADLRVALEMAPDRIRPMLHLAAYAGLRACEISQLRGQDVHLETSPPLLVVAESKGGGMSSVPIAPPLAAELALLPRRGYLFGRLDGKPGPIPPHRVSQACNLYLHGLGITHTLHTLRHWFGTNAYRVTGRDLRATQELMRHSSPVSTAIYTWVDPGALADAVGALPTFGAVAV